MTELAGTLQGNVVIAEARPDCLVADEERTPSGREGAGFRNRPPGCFPHREPPVQADMPVRLLKANKAVDLVVRGQAADFDIAEAAFRAGKLPNCFAFPRHR